MTYAEWSASYDEAVRAGRAKEFKDHQAFLTSALDEIDKQREAARLNRFQREVLPDE